jgi:hypothetical protein
MLIFANVQSLHLSGTGVEVDDDDDDDDDGDDDDGDDGSQRSSVTQCTPP